VWVAIRAAVEADPLTAAILLEEAEIFMEGDNMTSLIDTAGQHYEVPVFMLNDPVKFHVDEAAKVVKEQTAEDELIKIQLRHCYT
jgi:hypothetical protein